MIAFEKMKKVIEHVTGKCLSDELEITYGFNQKISYCMKWSDGSCCNETTGSRSHYLGNSSQETARQLIAEDWSNKALAFQTMSDAQYNDLMEHWKRISSDTAIARWSSEAVRVDMKLLRTEAASMRKEKEKWLEVKHWSRLSEEELELKGTVEGLW